MNVKGAYSIYPPLGIDSEFHKAAYSKFIDHFQTTRHLKIRGSFAHDGEPMSVCIKACPTRFKKKFLKSLPYTQATKHMIEFSGSFKFPGTKKYFVTDHQGHVLPHSRQELYSIWRSELPSHLDLTIQTYLCGLMIAFPGAARSTGNVWLLNGKQNYFARTYVSIIHRVRRIPRRKWLSAANGHRPRDSYTMDFLTKRHV